MTVPLSHLRHIIGICALLLALLLPMTTALADTIDVACLRDAARERTNRLRDAQDRLRDDIRGAVERLERDESDALNFDLSFRQQELARATSTYSIESGNRWRDYSVRTSDAWNNYNQRRSKCYESAIPGTIPATYTPPNYGNQYQNYSGGSYGSYPYNYSYPYNSYTGYQGYNGYSGYNGYTDDNNQNSARGCTQRTLSAPPAGCSYRYGTDSNGCPSYTPVCSNAFSTTTSCTCSSQYAPVCTQDGRTFFNACYAVCLGANVKYQGSCYQY